ncbi:blast:Josephin-like protein [Drosophila guanche]|uniref:ubiquitinyl hydrolase 1 n=2 Tax=Drosophila guanche TaxID=7266 RepID=A0A3B0KNE5_DROGU|nr:blast:Josephin-like protein [Drosophila guanche]
MSVSCGIYHERQSRQLCALHALNNLFQGRDPYTKSELDEYCYSLTPRSWLNPHRSWFGWGNYDVNVIMYALQQHHCETVWFDKRRDPKCLNLDQIMGFILNVRSPLTQLLPPPFRMRHWLALRCINGRYYNLDSKLRQPTCLGNEANFLNYLREQLRPHTDQELFIVMTNDPTKRDEGDDATTSADSEQMRVNAKDNDQRWLKPQFRNAKGNNTN